MSITPHGINLPERPFVEAGGLYVTSERALSPDRLQAFRGSNRRLASGAARGSAVEIARAFFESSNHAADRLVKQHLDQPL